MRDWLYRLLAMGLQFSLWGGELTGSHNLPEKGPAVFVANHVGVWGPIATVSCIPCRVYPWVVGEMMEADHASEYLRFDFVERQLHLTKPLSVWVSNAISKLSVPLLTSAGCIPVHNNFDEMLIPFNKSVEVLIQGGFILIFPEDPAQPPDPLFKMSPFKKGFVRLGEFFHQQTGSALAFYPLAVNSVHRIVQVGKPVLHNPYAQPVSERLRVKHVLERMIHEMLNGMTREVDIRIPLPW